MLQYIIATEDHKDTGKHLHVYLKKPKGKKFDYTGPNCMLTFDVTDISRQTKHHPNIVSSVRSLAAVTKYCTKDGDFITNFYKSGVYSRILACDNWTDAQGLLADEAPRDLCLYGTNIKKNFDAVNAPVLDCTTYFGPAFPLSLHSAFAKSAFVHGTHSLAITGPSGAGKTQFALYLGAHLAGSLDGVLWITHLDGLRARLHKRHSVIIFDDMSFHHMPPTSWIALTDLEQPREIHCRYTNPVIPARVTRIFTSNGRPFVPTSLVPGVSDSTDIPPIFGPSAAVKRRLVELSV